MRSRFEYQMEHNRKLKMLFLQRGCRAKRKRIFALACERLQRSLRRRNDSVGLTEEIFNQRWIAAFASDVPQEKIEKYVLSNNGFCNYIWHVFSWRLIPDGTYLVGDAAREAYRKADKEGAVFIEPFEDMNSCPLLPVLSSPRLLDQLCTEVYITAADFSWTYIKTHEGDSCGPYFYQKKL